MTQGNIPCILKKPSSRSDISANAMTGFRTCTGSSRRRVLRDPYPTRLSLSESARRNSHARLNPPYVRPLLAGFRVSRLGGLRPGSSPGSRSEPQRRGQRSRPPSQERWCAIPMPRPSRRAAWWPQWRPGCPRPAGGRSWWKNFLP